MRRKREAEDDAGEMAAPLMETVKTRTEARQAKTKLGFIGDTNLDEKEESKDEKWGRGKM